MKFTLEVEVESPLKCPERHDKCCRLGEFTYTECESDTEFPPNCWLRMLQKSEAKL